MRGEGEEDMERARRSLAVLVMVVLVAAVAVVAECRQSLRSGDWKQDVYSTLFWIDVECCTVECYLQRIGLIDYQYDPAIDGVVWRVRLADWFSQRVGSPSGPSAPPPAD